MSNDTNILRKSGKYIRQKIFHNLLSPKLRNIEAHIRWRKFSFHSLSAKTIANSKEKTYCIIHELFALRKTNNSHDRFFTRQFPGNSNVQFEFAVCTLKSLLLILKMLALNVAVSLR